MRKFLLATTALVALTGAAQAAESPIQVTLGGDVDFRAALFQESQKTITTQRRDADFETEYHLSIAAEGKATNGITYGALVSMTNENVSLTANTTNAQGPVMDQAYVWMSGAFGKILMGDQHGASDLFVYAPTVGEGQIDGTYTHFTDAATLTRFQPIFINGAENDTKVTYYTPKVGSANHKVQLGVSYTPNAGDTGTNVRLYDVAAGAYESQVEAAVQYTGNFSPVNVVVSPMIATGSQQGNTLTQAVRDYTVWGVGAQAMYAGFTLGGSYVDAGHMATISSQSKDQDVWNLGLKYEFDKVAVAINGMEGEGYNSATFGTGATSYIKSFSAIGTGATYTWFPGLTSAADLVFFKQARDGAVETDKGHVLMLSQKMAF